MNRIISILTVCCIGFSGCHKYVPPAPVVTTNIEAMQSAKRFVSNAGISTNEFSMSNPSSITTDRIKGTKVWRIAWPPLPQANLTNYLIVLVFEDGAFYYNKTTNFPYGFIIEGKLSDLRTNGLIWGSSPNN